MGYSTMTIETVRSQNDIAQVISETGVALLPSDQKVLVGKCPFCGKEMRVLPDKQIFACFFCGSGGDVFSYVEKKFHCSFNEALLSLSKRCGTPIAEEPVSPFVIAETNMLCRINADAARYFFDRLRKSTKGQRYFAERKLSAETIIRFGLGYANGYDNDLFAFLKNKGYSVEQILESGLATENDGVIRDKFRNRVMFPIIDVSHHVIGFGGRVLVSDVKPKYLNSPESLIFNKSSNLFGLNSITPGYPVILCEGFMDVIQMQQNGFNAVASLGTSLTSLQIKLLKRYTNCVILSYDSDEPGQIASLRAEKLCEAEEMPYRTLKMSGAKDPDEYIKNFGKEAFAQVVAASI